MKWNSGRQMPKSAFYKVYRIFKLPFMDCYLIKYPKGLAIGYHEDKVPNKSHYRLNIHLIGKNYLCHIDNLAKKRKRIDIFRADRMHSYGITLEKGLILSFGIALKSKLIDEVF